MFQCVVDEGAGLVLGERLETEERGARDERGVDGEEGVLGGGADEGDEPAFDIGEQDILLRLGEAVDLVEEEDGAFVLLAEDAGGLVDDLADAFDADGRGVLADEPARGCFGDDLGEGGFAGTGRAVEDDGGEGVGVDHAAEELARPEQVGLPNDLVEGPGPHPSRQRCDAGDCLFAFGCPKVVHTGSVRVNVKSGIGVCGIVTKRRYFRNLYGTKNL